MDKFLQKYYKDGVMNLYGYKLTSIPMELFKFKDMKELNLSHNQLTSIPPELGQLVNLKILWLSYNQLTSIPKELGELRNLRIYIDNNPIDYLPPPIQRLLKFS